METTVFVLLAWIPLAGAMFALLHPVRALVLVYLVGWLALPMLRIEIAGFWDVDKVLATNAGALMGVLVFHAGLFKRYKLSVADVALLAFTGGACITSLSNGLGLYDGLSSMSHKLSFYGVPFVLGRIIIRSRSDLLTASRLLFHGAAFYAILAIWEWRMSPQIHQTLYGVFQHGWGQHVRWGFFRPVVCFPHALGLGVFFAWTALLGLWLGRSRRLLPVMGIPPIILIALPLIGLLATMSAGPWGLFIVGLIGLACWAWRRWRWVLLVPTMFAMLWMTGRYASLTDGAWFTSLVRSISPERADSLQYRIDAEMLLLERAKLRPGLGWGSWGRNRVKDDRGRDMVATDGLWIILVGSYGLVGLCSFYLWWCWPVVMSVMGIRELERDSILMPLLIAFGLQAVNLLFNGFLSPLLTVMNGAVVTVLMQMKREQHAVTLGPATSAIRMHRALRRGIVQ